MKPQFIKALLALAAIVTLTACDKADYAPEAEDFVGRWEVRYADDKGVAYDSSVTCDFRRDGTFTATVCNFLGSTPEEQSRVYDGTWTLAEVNGKPVLKRHHIEEGTTVDVQYEQIKFTDHHRTFYSHIATRQTTYRFTKMR